MRTRTYFLIGAAVLVSLLAGCGGSGGGSTVSTVSSAQIREARQEGEASAKEHDRVDDLQRQVHQIRRRLNRRHGPSDSSGAPAPAPTPEAQSTVANEGTIRSFHAPTGNVSCEVTEGGATCAVESVGETFVLEAGSPARLEDEAALPPSLGEEVGYDETVQVGSITCEVPPSDVARGITCFDSADGHGFEASRVSSRQKAY